MANEISIEFAIACTNGEFQFDKSLSFRATQTTAGGGQPGTVACSTSDAAISISGLSAPRWCYMKNIGANTVDIGPTSGGAIVKMIRLLAGEGCPVSLTPSVALRCQTTTGTSSLQIHALET